MELFTLTEDLNILYVTAHTFPEGIVEAFERLEKKVGNTENRTLFGISKPNEQGIIIYKAGTQEAYQEEAATCDCQKFVLTKGTYLTEIVKDWRRQISKIGETFDRLLSDPRLDQSSHCIEWYKGEDVLCMVKIIK